MAKSEDHYTRVAEQLIEKLKEGRPRGNSPGMPGGTAHAP